MARKATKKPPAKKKRGSTGKWDPKFIKQAEQLALDGWTNEKIAKFFGVRRNALQQWMVRYKELRDVIHNAHDLYDMGPIEKSLKHRAIGYDYEERTQELFNVQIGQDDNGKPIYAQEMRTTKIVNKHVPADPNCIEKWLHNRAKDRWKPIKALADGEGGNVLIQFITSVAEPVRLDEPLPKAFRAIGNLLEADPVITRKIEIGRPNEE